MATKSVPAEVRVYMSEIGARRTEAKTASSRLNVAKAAEARRVDPLTRPCTCRGGDSVIAPDHKTTCPRGNILYQRERAAQKKREVTQ